MKTRAVPLLALGIAGLFLASAAGAVVVSNDEQQVSTGPSTTSSTFPPFEDTTTTAPPVTDTVPTVVTEVPAPPASVVPVAPPASTATTTAPVPMPVAAVDPAPCNAPAAQPAAGAAAGPVGVFTSSIANGSVRLVGTAARTPAWRAKSGQVVSVAVAQGKASALCLSGPDGGGAKRLTTPAGVGRPALSFDGARLAVRSARSGGVDLVVGSVEGADQKLILQSSEIGDPVWLGDGTAVVTCAVTGGARRLVSIPAGGGDPKVLREPCPASPVASSPDGSRIAFAQGDQVTVLEVGNRATTSLRIGIVATNASPTWSPDGKRVAFAYSDAQGPALGVLDLVAKSGATRLRAPGLTGPRWAPAGDLIAYTANDGTAQGLFVVKPDGTGQRRVSPCQTRCTLAPQPFATDGLSVALELSS